VLRATILVALLVAANAPESDAQFVKDWHAVTSGHFELISRYDPVNMGKLLQELEWVRAVFVTNLAFQSKNDRPVLIYLPDSPYDYEQTSPSKHSDGYYLAAPFRDVIVLRSFAGARAGLFHEYTHLMLNHHMGPRLPGWFNEGTAEYFAMMRKTKDGVEAGVSNPLRLRLLKRGAWLPVSYMIATETPAALPTPDAMQRFYAQASIYVHMLHLSPAYREGLVRFTELLVGGVSAEEALTRVYSKSALQFDNDARDWFRQNKLPVEQLKAPPEDTIQVKTRKITPIEEELARLTVAVGGPRRAQVKSDYARLAKAVGDDCSFQAPLGDLAYAGGLMTDAEARYQKAENCGVKVSGVMERTRAAASGPRLETRRIEAERRADPDHDSFLDGTGHFFAGNFEGAVGAFEKIGRLPHADQFRMTRLKALALAKLGRFDEADREAGDLQEFAAGAEQRETARLTCEEVRAARESAAVPPEPAHKTLFRSLSRVEGDLVRVDCLGTRAVFWIRTGKDTIKLLLADPSDVITGSGDAPKLEFSCGAQKKRISIGYQPEPDPARGTLGRIRVIESR